MDLNLCDEIKRIPFKIACELMGFDDKQTNEMMKIEENKKLIEEGLNDLYYLLTFGTHESNILAKYCNMISEDLSSNSTRNSSQFYRDFMMDYMKLVKLCMSQKLGKTVQRTEISKFASAAEDFALFGKLEPEDQEILYGKTSCDEATEQKKSTPEASQRIFSNRFPRNVPRNVVFMNPYQAFMPIFYKPAPVLWPMVPCVRPRMPTNAQWITRMGRNTVILPSRPAPMQFTTSKQVAKIDDVSKKEDSEEKKKE